VARRDVVQFPFNAFGTMYARDSDGKYEYRCTMKWGKFFFESQWASQKCAECSLPSICITEKLTWRRSTEAFVESLENLPHAFRFCSLLFQVEVSPELKSGLGFCCWIQKTARAFRILKLTCALASLIVRAIVQAEEVEHERTSK